MQQIVIQAVMAPGAAAAPEGAAASSSAGACDSCGQTFSQFRQSGLMGCPRCYAAFEGQLGPLLSRAHEGGTHHVGKSPRSAAGGKTPPATSGAPESAQSAAPGTRARAAALRKQLSEAVAAEQYERAAGARDECARWSSLRSRHPRCSRPRRGLGGASRKAGTGQAGPNRRAHERAANGPGRSAWWSGRRRGRRSAQRAGRRVASAVARTPTW